MNIFTEKEVHDAHERMLADSSPEEFKEFMSKCRQRAKNTVKFFDALAIYATQLFLQEYYKIDIPPITTKQLALIRLADAVAQEIYDIMIEQKLKETK